MPKESHLADELRGLRRGSSRVGQHKGSKSMYRERP
jgi:hypothetical protein